jgi:hypothetical protein
MPARDDETSTFRLEGLSGIRARLLGRLIVSMFKNGFLYGRAYLPASAVTEASLSLKAERLSLHVGIRGWPVKTEKARRKFLAAQLARRAKLEIYSPQ